MLPFAHHFGRRAWLALLLLSPVLKTQAEIRSEVAADCTGLRSSCSERVGGPAEVVGLAPELRWTAMGRMTTAHGAGSGETLCIASDSFRSGTPVAWMAALAARRQGSVEFAFDPTLAADRAGDDRTAQLSGERSIFNPR